MPEFTHFDEAGASRMVNVGAKPVSQRVATASATVVMAESTLDMIRQNSAAKGNVLEVARLAGIMATKRTADLIPLCHTLPIDRVDVEFEFPSARTVRCLATVGATARTGVEMEALSAAAVTALTIYDMCKAVDRAMTIERIQLESKSGGQSGDFRRTPDDAPPPQSSLPAGKDD